MDTLGRCACLSLRNPSAWRVTPHLLPANLICRRLRLIADTAITQTDAQVGRVRHFALSLTCFAAFPRPVSLPFLELFHCLSLTCFTAFP